MQTAILQQKVSAIYLFAMAGVFSSQGVFICHHPTLLGWLEVHVSAEEARIAML
jgi:hypothetical protein